MFKKDSAFVHFVHLISDFERFNLEKASITLYVSLPYNKQYLLLLFPHIIIKNKFIWLLIIDWYFLHINIIIYILQDWFHYMASFLNNLQLRTKWFCFGIISYFPMTIKSLIEYYDSNKKSIKQNHGIQFKSLFRRWCIYIHYIGPVISFLLQ